MKTTLQHIALFKRIDASLQLLLFGALICVCLLDIELIGHCMFIFGGFQVLSCISWLLVLSGDVPRYSAGVFIRWLFIVILAIIGMSCFIGMHSDLLFTVMVIMLLVGPLCGLAYFIITLLEYGYYSRARKPYYLL